jgi:hypothetical protein
VETARGSMTIPEAEAGVAPTSDDKIDEAVSEVRGVRDGWLAQDVQTRLAILEELMATTFGVAERWVEIACEARRIDPDSPTAADEWLGPSLTMANLRSLHTSLEEIAARGLPEPPGEPYVRPDGRVTVPAVPRDRYERGIFDRITAEIRFLPGVTPATLPEMQAVTYQLPKTHEGRVALVLGAGNVSAIPLTDTLYKLFVEDQVVVLKPNPVNGYLAPIFEEAFASLVAHGFLRVVHGGAEQGERLARHDGVDTIHVTGSDKTHDALVFGPGEDGRRAKKERTPRLTKPVTSELGSVSPVIVVPGPWTAADFAYHGRNIASMLTNNAGFNCVAAGAVLTHKAWSGRQNLLDAVREVFGRTEPRYAYYPGAEERWRRFLAAHPEAGRYGHVAEGCLPWTLVPGLDPDTKREIAFDTEVFSPLVAEVALDSARDVSRYLDEAVAFCNERLWGSLSASIIVHPRQMTDPRIAQAVERAIDDLRYGTVVQNHWMGLPYALMTLPWGAYPGHDMADIQSGTGVVHNTLMYENREKSVVRAPFRTVLDPPWFVSHPNAHQVLRALTTFGYERTPASYAKVLGYFALDGQVPRPSALSQYPGYIRHAVGLGSRAT